MCYYVIFFLLENCRDTTITIHTEAPPPPASPALVGFGPEVHQITCSHTWTQAVELLVIDHSSPSFRFSANVHDEMRVLDLKLFFVSEFVTNKTFRLVSTGWFRVCSVDSGWRCRLR